MASVIGLVRFSYLTRSEGFSQMKGLGLEQRAERLFAPERLDARFRLFERVCLPSLLVQPQDRFRAVILASTRMPEVYRERLRAVIAPHPSIRASFQEPGMVGRAFARALSEVEHTGETRCTFRLDDDDAVSTDFTDRMGTWLHPAFHGVVVSPAKGVEVARRWGRPRLWTRTWIYGPAGMALITRADAEENVYFCGNHVTVGERYPVLVDSRSPSFLMTSLGFNISRRRVSQALRYARSPSEGMDALGGALAPAFGYLADVDWLSL